FELEEPSEIRPVQYYCCDPYTNAPNSKLPDVKPDLSSATAGEQQAIEHACDTAREAMAKQFYYECLSRDLTKLGYR
ncbi:MAG: hypothetical protein WAW61_09420, partial [Methylococcaceae bacterium]